VVTARLPGALVGRERELALLEASLDTAQSGRPGITLVVGEAGIGKTRLVDEGAVIARAAGMRVLRARPTVPGGSRWSSGAESTARSASSHSAT